MTFSNTFSGLEYNGKFKENHEMPYGISFDIENYHISSHLGSEHLEF